LTRDNKFLIEVKYDDILVEEAEILFEKKVIVDVSYPEKNLFVFSLSDDKDYEVEIFKPFTKIQKTTCTCAFHQQYKICRHAIACLMFLRNQKMNEANVQQVEKIPKTKTLNIGHLLSNVSREELIQFVKNYAKSDPKFLLQLKVFFARKVDLSDNKEKYKTILDSVIKPNTGQSKPTSAELRAFLSINKELAGQTEDCLALEQFEEAADIFEACFYKFEYVRYHYGLNNDSFTEQSIHWHNVAESFYKEKMSRSLINRVTFFLTGLATKSFYRYTNIFNNLIFILEKVLDKKNKEHLVSEVIPQLAARPDSEKPLLMALVCFLSPFKNKNVIPVMDYPTPLFLPFIHNLIKLREIKMAGNFLENKIQNSSFEKEWYFLLMDVQIRQYQYKKAFDYLTILFSKTGEIQYVTHFKNTVSKEDWINDYSVPLEKKLMSNEKIHPAFLLSYFQLEEKWDELLSILEKHPEMALYLSFAPNLFLHRKEIFSKRLLQLIFDWLEHHAGENSYHFLHSVFKQLDKSKLSELKLYLKENIRKKYKERKGLITFLDSER
jgi:hypothetical protein